jgi:recombination protein RecR
LLSSKLIENAVNSFASLPGIGKKTALRLALHLLQQEKEQVKSFADSIVVMKDGIVFCKYCHNVSDHEICSICENPNREKNIVCVVEGIRDVMAIENTNQYNGLYHVLGGVISPIDGVGPSSLNIDTLLARLDGEVNELIMALNPTIEGDTTIYYLAKRVKDFNVKITSVARGISFGGELEYADELTLGRSISGRTLFEGN